MTSQELDSPARPKPALPRSVTAVVAVLGALYTAAVLYATLRPLPWATDGNETPGGVLNPAAWTDLSEWISGRPGEVLFNVILFLPVGIAAGLLFRGWVRIAIPVVLTFGIEILQIPMDDRISHPRDLVVNTLGGLLGIAVATAIRRSRTRR